MEKEKEAFEEVLNENGYRYTYINYKLVHVWDCINHVTILDKREQNNEFNNKGVKRHEQEN